jgi:uncharacterized DUF497 family protein
MRFVPDESTASWLEDFSPDPDHFDWDKGNIDKNLKHGISSGEIESLFSGLDYVFFGQIVEPIHSEWRGLIVGETATGKYVSLVFTRRGDRLRPISYRATRLSERRRYEKEKNKEKN